MELWKDIKGYEGVYMISNMGQVKSLNYRNTGKESIVKINTSRLTIYPKVKLRKNGVSKDVMLHRLLAQHFIHNPNNYSIVNHKDENKKNFNLDNLEWCDNSYNVNYSINKRKEEKLKLTKQAC